MTITQAVQVDRSISRTTARVGFWSASLSFVFGTGYIVAQAAQWMGLTPSPWHLITLTFPSFWLALSFVVLMTSIYHYASDDKKVWGHVSLAFAIMYATLNASVYFLQMTVVVPTILNGQAQTISNFVLSLGTPIYGLDILGYGLMSLSTLLAAPIFGGGRLEWWVRWSLVANGLLAPAILLTQNYPTFPIATLWAITFPLSTALLATLFKQRSPTSIHNQVRTTRTAPLVSSWSQ